MLFKKTFRIRAVPMDHYKNSYTIEYAYYYFICIWHDIELKGLPNVKVTSILNKSEVDFAFSLISTYDDFLKLTGIIEKSF